jgi:hypothetical protein
LPSTKASRLSFVYELMFVKVLPSDVRERQRMGETPVSLPSGFGHLKVSTSTPRASLTALPKGDP